MNNMDPLERLLTEPIDRVIEKVLSQHLVIKKGLIGIKSAINNAERYSITHRGEINAIKTKFDLLMENLEIHMFKEAMVLYPEFIKLWNKIMYQSDIKLSFNLMYPIDCRLSDHKTIQLMMDEINESCRCILFSNDGCENIRVMYTDLRVFKKMLLRLIHVEDKFLFPEVLALEKILNN